jgi:two-component system, chemotaxis family, chemotaxis protein CheY
VAETDRLTVLVVDDNLHMRAIIKALLRAFNITNIVEAGDGAEALDLLNTREIDLIIADYSMPILDGIEFVSMVRTSSDSKNPFVPIIMVSGHSSHRSISRARDTGVTEFMVKPITAKGLHDRIVSIVERPRGFVRAGGYFGPDRRRKNPKSYAGPFRRSTDQTSTEI